MLDTIIHSIVEVVSDLGYAGIVVMMFLESTFFPFPSEVVMIPAGYLAAKGEMNLYIVIILGILGSVLGALFNFYLALHLGRAFVLRFGRYFFFKEKHLEEMETFFKKHGIISTFTGRLIPGVRQYISLPAGLARMNLTTFTIFTALGAGIWSAVLALVGFFIGENQALIDTYMHSILFWTLITITVIVIMYVYRHKKKNLDIDK